MQLWSYNYPPEPSGIAPLSAAVAQGLSDRGHSVEVVAAHPHYPTPLWGRPRWPYRERRSGIPVLRLPLWIGRDTTGQRIRQELTFAAAQGAVAGLLPRADVILAVSPSFPALAAVLSSARVRRTPWVLWVQDILPDGATTTGIMADRGPMVRWARALELAAYRHADRIVVISESFAENLRRKGVPEEKLSVIYNPAPARNGTGPARRPEPGRVLCMGNIGRSQGLTAVVRAFEGSPELRALGARLRIAGDGVEAPQVREAVTTDKVELLGVLFDALEEELTTAAVGLVTQRPDILEFNVPSKLMNYMHHAVPVVGFLRPESEPARLIERSGGGWVLDARRPEELGSRLAAILGDPGECARRGAAARTFALQHFAPERAARHFERDLAQAVAGRRGPGHTNGHPG